LQISNLSKKLTITKHQWLWSTIIPNKFFWSH